MKKAQMNICYFCFILFSLKIFDEIVTTLMIYGLARLELPFSRQLLITIC